MTTPSLTVAPLVVDFLQGKVGNTYNVTAEYCSWNVTRMIRLINDSDPLFLYEPTTKSLLVDSGYLPLYIIKQFPSELLSFYGLNYTVNDSEDCGSGNDETTNEIDFCVGPLIHTDIINPVNEEKEIRTMNLQNFTGLDITVNVSLSDCGLACSEGAHQYGLTDNEQNIVDLSKMIGCSFCFVAIIFNVINQCVDQKRTGKKFVKKPLLQTIPQLITLSLFLLIFLMTLGEWIGSENILCTDNEYENDGDDKRKEFSFYNPIQGKNIVCTIHGAAFYSSLLMYQLYTVLLSFVIFRQLLVPLRPLWKIRQRYWHIGIFVVILIMIIVSLVTSSYGGVWPMSVCFPGAGHKKYQLFGLVVLPFLLSATASVFLFIASSYLLRKEINSQKKVANTSQHMQDLLFRLILYGIGICACLILLSWTAMKFFIITGPLTDDMNKVIECQIIKILMSPDIICPERTVTMHPFYFISWVIAAILGVTAQIILSCHSATRDRLKRTLTLGSSGDKTKSKSNSKKNNVENFSSRSPSADNDNVGRTETLQRIDSGSYAFGVELISVSDDIGTQDTATNIASQKQSEPEEEVP